MTASTRPSEPPKNHKAIVLASQSPRRQALLASLGIEFEIIPSDTPERLEGKPEEVVVTNAKAKRDAAAPQSPEGSLIIGADTLVFLDDHPLGKPTTLDEASAMISRLSGQRHQVLTGLAMVDLDTGKESSGFETTDVIFRFLSPEEIGRFVETVRPLDRAGAYTVDGPGSLLVAGFRGCYQNVLGLPIVRLDELLRPLGYSLYDFVNPHKARFL